MMAPRSLMIGMACIVPAAFLILSPAAAQNIVKFQVISSGASSQVSSNGTTQLFSAVGQPPAYSAATPSGTQAGFLQISNYVTVDETPPEITYETPSQGITAGSSLSVTITDNIKVTSAKLFYRPISSETFTSVDISGSDNQFTIAPQPAWYDALGMEYYFEAKDASGNSSRNPETGSYYAYLTQPSVIVPQLTAGTKVTNYHIISMPYSANGGDDIANIFGSASGLPEYADTRWRVATYDNARDEFIEPSSGLTKFERGKGYWFITKTWPQGGLKLGQQTAPANNRSNLYSLTLKPGWNQIGNPYPVPIKWSDVQNFEGNPDVASIKTYEGGWADGDEIKPFQGGFVMNDGSSDIEVKIPFIGQSTEDGRKQEDAITSNISADTWRVSLHIFQNDQFNKIAGFGMSPESEAGIDHLDDYNPPAFVNSPEVNFYDHARPELLLAKDMVPPTEKFTWKFQVSGESGTSTELRWNDDLGAGSEELFLVDEASLEVVNMREQSHYTFTLSNGHSFAIYFGDPIRDEIGADQILVAGPAPNPAINRRTAFNLGFPQEGTYETLLTIFSPTGTAVYSDRQRFDGGIHQWNWVADESVQPGLYYYRLVARSSDLTKIFTGKILIP